MSARSDARSGRADAGWHEGTAAEESQILQPDQFDRPFSIGEVEYSAAKGHRTGTHRTRSPRETLELFEPRMGEFGVTRLADVTGLDHVGVPVFMSVRPNSRGLAVSQGKGLDRDAAKASALMESIEGWHAERIERPLRYDSYAALRRSESVIDVSRLSLRRNARLERNAPRLWIEGFDLLSNRAVWVPFESVMTNYVRPLRVATTFYASSNGRASGNHMLEAAVHGLCELIERDACAIWAAATDHGNSGLPIDLASVRDDGNLSVLERLRAAQLDVAVWDITCDTRAPAFWCQISDPPDGARWTLKGSFSGYGCHLSAELALLRALTEAVQSRLTGIAGSRDDMFDYSDRANPDDLENAARIGGEPGVGGAFPFGLDLSRESFQGDLRLLLEALRRIGIAQVVLVDLTRDGLDVPVVKLVVPGLEGPLDSQYVPGHRAQAAARDARVAG